MCNGALRDLFNDVASRVTNEMFFLLGKVTGEGDVEGPWGIMERGWEALVTSRCGDAPLTCFPPPTARQEAVSGALISPARLDLFKKCIPPVQGH